MVVAAGTGSRFGGAKQYEMLGRRRVLDYALDAARALDTAECRLSDAAERANESATRHGFATLHEVATAVLADPERDGLVTLLRERAEAEARALAALDETEVDGLVTNLPFLRWLVAHPALREGRTTTAFLTEHPPLSAPPLRLPGAVGSPATPVATV